MEALGVSIVAAAGPTSIVCGRNRRKVVTASSSSSSAPQFSQAQETERKSVAVPCRSGDTWETRSKLAFASLVTSGLAHVQAALALSYDEVVGTAQEAADSVNTDAFSFELPELDTSTLTNLFNSDPLALLLGGSAIIAIPVILSTAFKQPEGYGAVSANEAFEKLGDKESSVQLLDIRAESEGTPDLKVYKKTVTRVPYTGESDEYVAKVLKKFKDAENTTIYVFDEFDGESLSVAKLLGTGGFKAAYAVKGGAEGPGGWKASELPWLVPRKFNLDLGGIKGLIPSSDTGSVLPATLGAVAAAGVGFVVFSEAETALQLLGSAALVQLFVKKFLYAEDRKRTIQDLKTFLDTKVAPKEFVDELKEIGGVLLPKDVQAAASNGAALVENVVAESAATVEDTSSTLFTETTTTVKDETSAVADETAAVVDETAAVAEETLTSTEPTYSGSTELPRASRPLSPYAQYPGLKPPSSPSPSRP